MTSTLSEGRSRRSFLPLVLFLAGIGWLAVIGAWVVVRDVIGWLT
jgi:hypothetical protein